MAFASRPIICLLSLTLLSGSVHAGTFRDLWSSSAVLDAYTGQITPDKTGAAHQGLRELLGFATDAGWAGSSYSSTVMAPGFGPGFSFQNPGTTSLQPAVSVETRISNELDLGPSGAAIELVDRRLILNASISTNRALWVGLQNPAPPNCSGICAHRPDGNGYIDTNGYEFLVRGKVTARQTLFKEGEGVLSLTNDTNEWHIAPEVRGGILRGTVGSLNTDIKLAGGSVQLDAGTNAVFTRQILGSGRLIKGGTATLSVAQTQTDLSRVQILDGTLALTNGAVIKAGAQIGVDSRAALDLTTAGAVTVSALTGTGDVQLGANALTFAGNALVQVDARLSGSDGAIAISDGSRVRLTAANDHALTAVSGQLIIADGRTLGAPSGRVVLDNGSLELDAGNGVLVDTLIEVRESGSIHASSTGNTLNQGISGEGSLVLQGGGTFELNGPVTLTGSLAIRDSTVQVHANDTLGTANTVVLQGGSTLRLLNPGETTLGNLAGSGLISSAGSLALSGNESTTLRGMIDVAGDLTKRGTGTLDLKATTSVGGRLKIEDGEVTAAVGRLPGRIENNALLRLTGETVDTVMASDTRISGGGTLIKAGKAWSWMRNDLEQSVVESTYGGILMTSAQRLTADVKVDALSAVAFYEVTDASFAQQLSGEGGLFKFGPGALTLASANSHKGGTFFEGTIAVADGAALGASGSVVGINDGTLRLLDTIDSDHLLWIGSLGGRIDTGGHDLLWSGDMFAMGDFEIVGGGSITLTGDIHLDPAHSFLLSGESISITGQLSFDLDASLMALGPTGIGARALQPMAAAPVPEPASFAMMVAGLALLAGATSRARRRS